MHKKCNCRGRKVCPGQKLTSGLRYFGGHVNLSVAFLDRRGDLIKAPIDVLLQKLYAFDFIAGLDAEQYGTMFGLRLGTVDPIHVDPPNEADALIDVAQYA